LTGENSQIIRLQWEATHAASLKKALITYNIEDCRAAEVVARAMETIVNRLPLSDDQSAPVDVDTLKVPYSRTYGPFNGATKDFEAINRAAYWNYQREKVYIRSPNKRLLKRQSKRRSSRNGSPRPDKIDYITGHCPEFCHKCSSRRIWKPGCQEQTTIDITFSKKGVRRQIIRQRIQRYRCAECRAEYGALRGVPCGIRSAKAAVENKAKSAGIHNLSQDRTQAIKRHHLGSFTPSVWVVDHEINGSRY
jgi:hypothetical protein